MSLLVGLDVGTSCVKAGLFDAGGHRLSSASAAVDLYIPRPGWAEQDPGAWWQAACQVLREVTVAAGGAQVAALGLAGQCPGHVLVDGQGQALGRAIIWRDQRAQAEAQWLKEHVSPERARQCLAGDTVGEATAPLARLVWLKKHRPGDWEAAASVLQPKDYVAFLLTGRAATDRLSAYGLAGPQGEDYPTQFFEELGLDPGKLPGMLLPSQVLGTVTPQAGLETGLAAGTPVVTGTIDAYCDALAGGIAGAGTAVDVAGTSEIISLHIDRPVEAQGVFPTSLGDGIHFLCGPTQAGGETLRWMAHNFYPGNRDAVDFPWMEMEARSAPPGCDGMVFLPYLNGERAPLWDARARGCFYGLTFGHQRGHFTRAVYEGVAYAVRHVLELSEAAGGARAEQVVVCGGGARSRFWNQVKADVLQREVYPAEIVETGCLGAARRAGVGVALYPDLRTASAGMLKLQEAVSPDPAAFEAYETGYRVYRHLYPALNPLSSPGADHFFDKGR
ncbi:MAG: FGGY family carbohydrate kinase [Anaerolineaceae bacterium]|nr:FGGY family carbohydrate kinase [Anaerolineaceae bacterium]